MKTLDQVQPRMPIDATHTPGDAGNEFLISQPGSYYLTSNIVTGKTNGITVSGGGSAGVIIDLSGFNIVRGSGSGGSGIVIGATADRCIVRNGSISGFQFGVNNLGGRGGSFIELTASNCTVGLVGGAGWLFDRCKAYDNAGNGIATDENSTLTNCVAFSNSGIGINAYLKCTLIGCTASKNQRSGILAATGCTLNTCSASENGGSGFDAGDGSTLSKCSATFNASADATSYGIRTGFGGVVVDCVSFHNTNTNTTVAATAGISVDYGSTIRNCSVSQNDGDGVLASDNCTITGCTIRANGARAGHGIVAGNGASIDHCAVAANPLGGIVALAGSTVSHCEVYANNGPGIDVSDGSTVTNCTLRQNIKHDGILLTGGCRIVENLCDQNGIDGAGSGIHATQTSSRIEGNTVTFNTGAGIKLDAGGNTVFRNSAKGNPTNYAAAAGNDVGPIGTAATATSPFANIQF